MGKATGQTGAHVVKNGIRIQCVYPVAVGDTAKVYFMYILFFVSARSFFIPQQRKLMRFSAQISSGVRRCGSQEEGSGSSGVCWCSFRRHHHFLVPARVPGLASLLWHPVPSSGFRGLSPYSFGIVFHHHVLVPARVPGFVSLLFWHPVPSSFPRSG